MRDTTYRMPSFIIRTCNSSFATRMEYPDVAELDVAHDHAVRGALMIASDEIYKGKNAVTVEIIIEDTEDNTLLRSAVTVSIAPLLIHIPIDARAL